MKYKGTHAALPSEPEMMNNGFTSTLETVTHSDAQELFHLRVLWNARAFIFRAVLCGLLASTLIAWLIPPRYKSTTRLMPPDNDSSGSSSLAMVAASMSDKMGALADTAGSFLGLKKSSDVFVGILGSRTVQGNLVQKFDLRKVYWDRRLEDACEDLEKHTTISVDRKSQIIEIAVSDRNPQRAAALAETYVEQLNRLVAELSTSSARRERIFLEGRLKEVSADLEAAEKAFGQFASKNTTIDIKEQGKAMLDAAATLQGELIAAQSELEGLRQIYNDNNVRVRSLRARVLELKLQLQRLGGEDESSSNTPNSQETSLYPSIRRLPVLGVAYADLYRRTRVEEAVFETLTRQYEMAKVQEAKEIPTVKVLDPPNIPEKKSFPPRLLTVFIGTILSVCLAIVWILGSDRWRRISSHQPGKQLATQVWVDVIRDFHRVRRSKSLASLKEISSSSRDQSDAPAEQTR